MQQATISIPKKNLKRVLAEFVIAIGLSIFFYTQLTKTIIVHIGYTPYSFYQTLRSPMLIIEIAYILLYLPIVMWPRTKTLTSYQVIVASLGLVLAFLQFAVPFVTQLQCLGQAPSCSAILFAEMFFFTSSYIALAASLIMRVRWNTNPILIGILTSIITYTILYPLAPSL